MGGWEEVEYPSTLIGILLKKLDRLSVVCDDIETCTVCVSASNRSIVIIAIYRPPGGSLVVLYERIMEYLNDPSVINEEIIVTGDLNIVLTALDDLCVNTKNFVYAVSFKIYISYYKANQISMWRTIRQSFVTVPYLVHQIECFWCWYFIIWLYWSLARLYFTERLSSHSRWPN